MNTFDKQIYKIIVIAALATLTTGTIVYHVVEKLSWVDAYYFSVVTLATVGYGDIVPHTTFGKLFTTFYIFIGVGIITTFITATMKRRGATMRDRHDKKEQSKSD